MTFVSSLWVGGFQKQLILFHLGLSFNLIKPHIKTYQNLTFETIQNLTFDLPLHLKCKGTSYTFYDERVLRVHWFFRQQILKVVNKSQYPFRGKKFTKKEKE